MFSLATKHDVGESADHIHRGPRTTRDTKVHEGIQFWKSFV